MKTQLDEIQSRIATTRGRIAALKSGPLESVGDRARERAILNEELALLTDAEAVERERLAKEAAEVKRRARDTGYDTLDGEADARLTEESRQRDMIEGTVKKLIDAVTAIEGIYRAGLKIPEGVLTRAELEKINRTIEKEGDRVAESLLGIGTRAAADCGPGVRRMLENLFDALPARPAGVSQLKVALAALRDNPPPAQATVTPINVPAPKSQGFCQSVDLRPPKETQPQHRGFVGGTSDYGGGDAA